MSKFCENCGAELKDTDAKCTNCGADVETIKKDVQQATNNVKNGDKKTLAIIGIIAAAVIVVLILLALILGGGYKTPLKNYFTGIQKTNSKVYVKAFPEVMKEDMEEKYDKDRLDKMMETFEKKYGDKIKISYKVLDKQKIEKDDLKDVKDDLVEDYDDTKIKVTDGYTVCVKVTVKGSDDKNVSYTTFDIYKVNGKWCMIND